jgi:WD40 repeat protein
VHQDSITSLKPLSKKRVVTASLDGYFAVFDLPSRKVAVVTQVEAPIRCLEVSEAHGLLLLLSGSSVITTVKCLSDFSDFELGIGTRMIESPILLVRLIDDRLYLADESKKLFALPLAALTPVTCPHQTNPKAAYQYHHLDWISEIYSFNADLLLTTSEDRTARLVEKATRSPA